MNAEPDRRRRVVLYLQLHQPFRLAPYSYLDVGTDRDYFDTELNRQVVEGVDDRCYGPLCALLERLAARHGASFGCALSISGTLLDQLELWRPRTIEQLREVFASERIELLCETAFHSLVWRDDPDEFRSQVELHRARLEQLFGRRASTFRNTELIVDETLVDAVEALDFDGLLLEGADALMPRDEVTRVHTVGRRDRVRVLPRHYSLSDDVAFRFTHRRDDDARLTAERWTQWILDVPGDTPCIGIYMDGETFGEHHPAESGIFEFLEEAVDRLVEAPGVELLTPGEALRASEPVGHLSIPQPFSWADGERDLSAWLGNPMQRSAHEALVRIGPRVRALAADAPDLLRDWRRLSTSDHLYYMSTAAGSDGSVHEYFSPFGSAHDAHIAFMNVLEDFKRRVEAVERGTGAD